MNKLKNSYIALAGHFVFIVLVVLVATKLHILNIKLEAIPNVTYDPSWYQAIAKNGYYYNPGIQSSVAFFPLFPLLWRWSHLDAYGISAFNFVLHIISLVLLVKEYKLNWRETLLTCSGFGLFYCWLPFAESVFLITGIAVLIGYKRNNLWLTAAGLFLASLSRSAAMVFIPAVLIVELLRWHKTNDKQNTTILRTIVLFASCCLAVITVAWIQWAETGHWFVFAKAHELWNKKLQLPALPISTWDNFKVLFLDTAALITGFICGIMLLGYLYTALVKKQEQNHPEVNFSLAYLGGVTLLQIIYGVQGEHTTYINSLNRYIFGTGFFLVFMIYRWRETEFDKMKILFAALVALAGIGLTGYFTNPYDAEQLLSARLDAVAILLAVIVYSLPIKKGAAGTLLFVAIYVFQTAMQLHLLELYLNGNWVG